MLFRSLENRVVREEREILKKTTQFFASQKPLDRTREHSGNWACIASPCDRSAGCADESRARTNAAAADGDGRVRRSAEHTSELQSLMRISYAVFCLKKQQCTQDTHT